MSKQITVRDDIYERLKKTKDLTGTSFSQVIAAMINGNDMAQEATITQEGRITKTLAGKTILYRIKQDNAQIDTTTATLG